MNDFTNCENLIFVLRIRNINLLFCFSVVEPKSLVRLAHKSYFVINGILPKSNKINL